MRKLWLLVRWGLPFGLGAVLVWRWRSRSSSTPAAVDDAPLRLIDPVTRPSQPVSSAPKPSAPKPAVPKSAAGDAAAAFGRKVVFDDVKVVEGIGPKIAELLRVAGISTWSALAACDRERLKVVLAEGGERFRMHEPTSWPQQAALAAAGDWSALKQLQDELKGGRITP